MSLPESTPGLVTAGVRAGARVDTWQDAVTVAGSLMTAAGLCTDEYVEAMAAGVVEFGPYIVIAPGVAMPHARPERGVLHPGTVVVTLDTPVEFGNPANDPVDLVIAFAAVDKHAHLESLQRITALLMDEPRLARVRAAATDEELRAALSGDTTTRGENR